MSIPALADVIKDGVSAFAGGAVSYEELDFGTLPPVTYKKFTVTNATVTSTSKIVATVTWASTLGRDPEELAIDPINIVIKPLTGSFEVHAGSPSGVTGLYGLTYQVNN